MALGMEAEIELLAEAVLEDGTKIATDSDEWKEGAMAFVVSEDGEKMPLPTGSYKTQDGLALEVEDGEVKSISKDEEEKSEEIEKGDSKKDDEEEMSSEVEAKEEVDMSAFATKEQLVEALSTLHAEFTEKIDSVITENVSLKEELENLQKMSAVKPVKHNQTNLSKQTEIASTGNKALDMMLKFKNAN